MLSKENQSKETSGTSPLECLLSQYKVDGFDPEAALTKVTEVDANGQPVDREYMKFQVMLAWFLTKFPEGCLNHTVFQLNERKAVVTGYIYRNQTDEKPAAVVCGISRKAKQASIMWITQLPLRIAKPWDISALTNE